MEWHQPWLLSLTPADLEDLHSECREREKANRLRGQFGLAFAWAGLAHEIVERALELERGQQVREATTDQLDFMFPLEHRGAYSEPGEAHYPAGD